MSDRRRRLGKTHRKLRVEQLCKRELLAGDLTNPNNPLDANGSGDVTSGDALTVINWLSAVAAGAEGEQAASVFPDVNGDNKVSSSDALQILNNLLEAEFMSSGPTVVRSLEVSLGRSVKIEYDGDNGDLLVRTPIGQTGTLEFTANGQTETVSIKDHLIFEVHGSGNELVLDRADIPDDLRITVKSGTDNTVRMFNTYIGDDFIFRGSGGREHIFIDDGTLIVENADINTRGGDDIIVVTNARVGDDFILRTEDGDDTLDVDGAIVGDDAIVRLGDGNDDAFLSNIEIDDVGDIDGNDGFDEIVVDVASVSARKLKLDDFESIQDSFSP